MFVSKKLLKDIAINNNIIILVILLFFSSIIIIAPFIVALLIFCLYFNLNIIFLNAFIIYLPSLRWSWRGFFVTFIFLFQECIKIRWIFRITSVWLYTSPLVGSWAIRFVWKMGFVSQSGELWTEGAAVRSNDDDELAWIFILGSSTVSSLLNLS